jgi:hypothetical protein
MVSADGEEAGVFALRAGVGLEGDGVEAGAFGEPGFELGEEGAVALGLRGGGEGVDGEPRGIMLRSRAMSLSWRWRR